MRQRIESLPPAVVNQIQRGIPLLIVNLIARKNFARVNDRRRQTRLHQFMQKRAVEHDSRRRLEAEADVAQADDGMAIRKLPRNSPRSLDGLQRVSPVLFDSGADRK